MLQRARIVQITTLLAVLHGAHGHAGEILALGKVLRVVPISTKSHVVERSGDCEPVKPARDSDLVALLEWDLRVDCRTIRREVEVVEAYRVYYEWDERVYDTVMPERPADSIPLRVTVH